MNRSDYYIWLVKCLGAGNPRANRILEKYDDIAEFYEDCKREIVKKDIPLSSNELANLHQTDIDDIKYVYDTYEKYHAHIITIEDELYPKHLKNIDYPPVVLFVVGDISNIDNELLLTVVGTRRESLYGRRACELICSELAVSGFSIVSGFANGGDTTAHTTAIKCGAKTYGFLACGLDVDYPYGKAALKNAVYKNGAVITEFLPGTKAYGKNFHIRNRIMSAISEGTLVIEAPSRSGTLITANSAINQGKDVFVVPSGIFWKNSAGIIELLKDGAKPVKDALDIIEEYIGKYPEKINIPDTKVNYNQVYQVNKQLGLSDENSPQSISYSESKKIIKETKKELKKAGRQAVKKGKNNIAENENANQPLEKRVSNAGFSDNKTALKIIDVLSESSHTADELAQETGITLSNMMVYITKMEMGKIIEKENGNRIKLIK